VLGAIVLLACGRIDERQALDSLDIPTLALLLGLMIVSAQLRLGGFYTRVTQRLAAASLSPPALLGLLVTVAALLSAVLANDVVCLAVTPVLAAGCLRRGLNPLPYLLALACASNIGSAATLIGNPQNMLIGQVLHLDFSRYLWAVLTPVLLSLAACWGLIASLTRGRWLLDQPEAPTPVEGSPPMRRETDGPDYDAWQAGKGLAVLAVLVGVMLWTDFPREIAALAAGGLLLCSRRLATREMLGQVDWHLLALFSGLFVVNHAFQQSGLMEQALHSLAAAGIDPAEPGWLFGITTVLSNLVSNVPAVMLMLPAVLRDVDICGPSPATGGTMLALVSTLAGNLLLVGSIANLIVAEQARPFGINLSWRTHARVGIPVTLASLAFAWAWQALVY
jgi:Na+/H+ antiporter NhaD/arsenite permease-like protein